MKRLLSCALALTLTLSLAGCGSPGKVTVTPEDAATPAPAPQEEAEQQPTAAPAGDFYAISSNYLAGDGFNTGDAWYSLESHLGYALVTKTDYATATRRVLCSVPGCTHDSESCPAWLPGRGNEVRLFTAGDTVYVYHPVATMHYEGSWDDYYAEVVEPKLKERPQGWEDLTDEELVTFCRGRYEECSAPAGLYCIEGDGASRQDIQTSQDLRNVMVGWCDGTALYGYGSSDSAVGNSIGYRISLADGAVTTFSMMPQENIVGAQEDWLLTSHIVTEVPLPDYNTEGWDAYQAVLQNATVEYDWLDPATGARSKVLERPHDNSTYGDADFFGLLDGKLYFEDWTPSENGDSRRDAFYAYDTATGQWQDLLRPIPEESMQLANVTVAALPGSAEQQGRYLWLSGSDNVNGENLGWMLDTQSGKLIQVTQRMEGEDVSGWLVGVVAFTDDGRFLVRTAQQEGEYGSEYVYGLIDAEAFLQGSTDYTPVTTVGR